MLDLLRTVSLKQKQIDRWLPTTKESKQEDSKPPLSFRAFIRLVTPHYVFYDHANRLIDVLQDVADGKRKRVMVFMPPRHSKSETVSRLFSAYYLYRFPERWVGILSYSADLAYGFSRNARSNYARSGKELSQAAWAVKQWETGLGGGLWANGIGGVVTGKGFHLGIIDDPIKGRKSANSELIRKGVQQFYDADFYTRQEPDAAIVVVNTRWHDSDLSGWLLRQELDEDKEAEHWHVVCMPAIKEVDLPFPATCTLEPDPRAIGEALCPERYNIKALRKIESRERDEFQSLYQQNPVAEGGNIFKSEWWVGNRARYIYGTEVYRNIVKQRYIFLDTADKDKETNDYTGLTIVDILPDYRLLVRRVSQHRIEAAYLPDFVTDLIKTWNGNDILKGIIIEDKASGTGLIGTLWRILPSKWANLVVPFVPTGSKEYRAKTASIWCSREMVLLPYPDNECEWLFDFADERDGQLFRFPNAPHDDMVDSFSMSILFLENILAKGYNALVVKREVA